MLRVAICEDNDAEAEQVDAMLCRYQEVHRTLLLQTDYFKSAEALLESTQKGREYDLYLLDIVMDGMDGITLAKQLRDFGRQGEILFLTSSSEYAVQAFRVRANNYLLKPLEEAAFFTALDDAMKSLGDCIETYTHVPTPEGERMVALSSIVCVEVTGHVMHFYLSAGQKLTTKVMRVSFEHAVADLTPEVGFMRPHQSFVVNAAHIVKIAAREFMMDNGMLVPISRLRYSSIRDSYMDFLTRTIK